MILSTPVLVEFAQVLGSGSGDLLASSPTSSFVEVVDTAIPLLKLAHVPIDNIGPTISSQSPVPSETDVARTSGVSFSLSDATTGVDLASLSVVVAGQNAVVAGAIQPGFDGVGSGIVVNLTNGYDVELVTGADWSSYQSVQVIVNVDDLAANSSFFNYTFTVEDYLGPLISPIAPLDGAEDYPVDANIVLDVTDEAGIVTDSVLVEVNDGSGYVTVFEQGGAPEFKAGWDGPGSSFAAIANGYRLTVEPSTDLDESKVFQVRVTAADAAGNPERLA